MAEEYKVSGGKTVIIGLQHTFVMFGATVLVPILTGLDVGVTLFAAGIGTLLFHVITKFKVPVFLGSSFSFIPGLIAIGKDQGLPYALGGILIAGLLYVVVAIIFHFVSVDVLHKILPAHVTGPMIVLIGMILAPVAISSSNGTNSPDVAKMIGTNGCWLVAAFTFAVGVLVKIAFPKWRLNFLSLLPVLLALLPTTFPIARTSPKCSTIVTIATGTMMLIAVGRELGQRELRKADPGRLGDGAEAHDPDDEREHVAGDQGLSQGPDDQPHAPRRRCGHQPPRR